MKEGFSGYLEDMIEKCNDDKLKENKILDKHPKENIILTLRMSKGREGINLVETKATITSTTMTYTKKDITKTKRSNIELRKTTCRWKKCK